MIRFYAIKACVVVSWEIAELFVGVNVRDVLKITSAASREVVSKCLLDDGVPIFQDEHYSNTGQKIIQRQTEIEFGSYFRRSCFKLI